jgi:hypothetical protein
MSLYREKQEICILSTSLLSKITQTLHQDESLMAQLEDLQVTSRVKGLLLLKLLKTKSRAAAIEFDEPSSDW